MWSWSSVSLYLFLIAITSADDAEERLQNLERDQTRLLAVLAESGFDVPMASPADGELDRRQASVSRAPKMEASRSRSPRWQDFGSRSEEEQEAVSSHLTSSVSPAYIEGSK
jgi:hypothetical protein